MNELENFPVIKVTVNGKDPEGNKADPEADPGDGEDEDTENDGETDNTPVID